MEKKLTAIVDNYTDGTEKNADANLCSCKSDVAKNMCSLEDNDAYRMCGIAAKEI